jgi:hypothetical protein
MAATRRSPPDLAGEQPLEPRLGEADEVNLRAQLARTLGQCQYRAGDTDLAMPRLMEALGIFHDQHDRYEEAYTLRWIAIAQRAARHD